MAINTKIQKWGNSLAVRLPQKIAARLGFKAGVEVVIAENRGKVVIANATERGRRKRRSDWKQFLLPANKKREAVSERIDEILYGQSC